MDAKHTPRPWRASQPDGAEYAHVSEDGAYVDGDICTTWSAGGNALANARLIAAAPVLLDACKQAAELFEDDEGIAQVLLAAIAAAEGREP